MKGRKFLLLPCAAVAALTLAACGGGGDSGVLGTTGAPTLTPITPTETVTAPPSTVTVTKPAPPTETAHTMNPPVDPCVEGNVDPSTWNTADDVYQFDSPDAQIVDIRQGRHECFDQITFVVDSPGDVGYSVGYTDGDVAAMGSGLPVPVAGDASLNVVITADVPVPDLFVGYDVSPGMPALKQVKYVASDRYKTQFAVGTAGHTPVAAEHFRSGDKTLVVVYVAHE